MTTVKHKNLKWGVYTSPQSDDFEFERYVIENLTDFENFLKTFPEIKSFGVAESMVRSLNSGSIIIATDKHPASGFPTWCFESKDNAHISSINRVRLGKIIVK